MSTIPFSSSFHWTDDPTLSALPEALKATAARVELGAGDHVFRIGAKPAAMFYVLAGEIRLTRYSPTGGEIVLQRTRIGFLAESSLDARKYHCDGVAIGISSLVRFPRSVFQHCVEQDHAFRTLWISHLGREVRRARAQCERLTLRSAAERILHFIESEGDDGEVTLSQSRKAWAAELGLSHEALYRTLARLQTEGVVTLRGNVISRSPLGRKWPERGHG